MLTKEKSLYQVKLILNYLPEEEYKLIPKETINYIETNFEYDENITIDPNIPLEEQKIDYKAYEMLDKIIKDIEEKSNYFKTKENSKDIKKETSKNYNAEIENIKLKNLVEVLQKENLKISKAKTLLEEYKEALNKKEKEIEKLKLTNEQLYDNIHKLPKFIRKIFLKDYNDKMLNS